MKERITITLDSELLAEIDSRRGLVKRSAWIEQILRDFLSREGYEKTSKRKESGGVVTLAP